MSAARTGLWFGVVGVAAALTHAAVFGLLQSALWPELANAAGFAVAFFVSFFGHRFLSFQDAGTGLWTSLRRFAATALLGFAVNEAVFVLLLRVFSWPSWPALITALVVAAGQTFVLSRFWAFRR
ncbi:GtrA family protein [Ottowia sp. SB7-C50]|uniref:GtrA family protein n=1 Tax=Ottowia sp. SB7-C50 TaxID=3081231 RepID=UPI002953FD88|nr:GtrA family protein [Ottowia sp. SB7-C50]WOP15792.1 GtrA family protein [Ottowia sp. SB7-C50]